MALNNLLALSNQQPQNPTDANNNQLNLNPTDANSWLQYLTGTLASNPNAKQNLSALSGASGIDLTGRYPGYEAARFLTGPEYYNLASQYGFYNQLQPEEHQALYNMLNLMMNPQMMVDQYRQSAQGAALQQQPQLLNQLQAQGAGQGVKEGTLLHASNEANRQANSYAANLFSPEGQAQRANTISQIYNSAMPNLGNLGQLQGIAVGTPRNQTGLGILGNAVGGALGQGGGAALGSLFG